MDPIARLFPYITLAAYYKTDSGDGDDNLFDMIEDTLKKWHRDGKVTRIYTSCDFSYVLETESRVLIVNLGTEGKKAWRENFDIFPWRKRHDGFTEAGKELAVKLRPFIKHNKKIEQVTYSRGGPRGIIAMEEIYDRYGIKIPTYTFNTPSAYTRRGKKEFCKKGLNNLVLRLAFPRDLVDNAGLNLLVHVGKCMRMPFVRTRMNSIPIVGWMFGGHAYSSDKASLLKYFEDRGMWGDAWNIRQNAMVKI